MKTFNLWNAVFWNTEAALGADVSQDVSRETLPPPPGSDLPENATKKQVEQSLDEALGGVFDKMEDPEADKDPKGEVENDVEIGAKKEDEDAAKKDDPDPQSEDGKGVDNPDTKKVEAPEGLTATQKEAWDKLPAEAQEHAAAIIRESSQNLNDATTFAKPFLDISNQYKHVFEANGLKPHEGFEKMMGIQQALDTGTPEQRAAKLIEIANLYGVDLGKHIYAELSEVFGEDVKFSGQDTAQADPKVAALEQTVQDLTKRLNDREQSEQSRENNQISETIKEFKADKENWDELESEITAQVHAVRTNHPNLGTKEVLEKAYKNAVFTDDKARAAYFEKQEAERKAKREAELKAEAEKAKKANSLNIESDPLHKGKPQSLDEVLSSKYDEITK